MTTGRLVQQSLRSIRRYPLRTIIMMLGSFVGVAALMFVLSVGRGAQTLMLRTVRQIMGDQAILVMGGGGTMMGGPRGGSTRLTLDDLESVVRQVSEIVAWDPQVQSGRASVKRGGASASVRVIGASERWSQVWGRGVSRGQDFDASAVAGTGRVAIIGETVARSLFENQDPVGGEVDIGNVPFRVIGVLDRFGVDLHGMDRDNEIVVPISTMMRRVKNTDVVSGAKLVVKDGGTRWRRRREGARSAPRAARAHRRPARRLPYDDVRGGPRDGAKIERVLFLYVPLVGAVALVVGGIVGAISCSRRSRSASARSGCVAPSARGRMTSGGSSLLETAVTIVLGGDRWNRAGHRRSSSSRRAGCRSRRHSRGARCRSGWRRRGHRTRRRRLSRATRSATQPGRCAEVTADRWTGPPVYRSPVRDEAPPQHRHIASRSVLAPGTDYARRAQRKRRNRRGGRDQRDRHGSRPRHSARHRESRRQPRRRAAGAGTAHGGAA